MIFQELVREKNQETTPPVVDIQHIVGKIKCLNDSLSQHSMEEEIDGRTILGLLVGMACEVQCAAESFSLCEQTEDAINYRKLALAFSEVNKDLLTYIVSHSKETEGLQKSSKQKWYVFEFSFGQPELKAILEKIASINEELLSATCP